MANQEHLDILKQGVGFWNQWGKQDLSHMLMQPDQSEADLRGMKLNGVDMQDTNLSWANLRDVNFSRANLI